MYQNCMDVIKTMADQSAVASLRKIRFTILYKAIAENPALEGSGVAEDLAWLGDLTEREIR